MKLPRIVFARPGYGWGWKMWGIIGPRATWFLGFSTKTHLSHEAADAIKNMEIET